MTLQTVLRAHRAPTTLACVALLALTPAVADAKAKHHKPAAVKKAPNTSPTNVDGLGNTLGLGPTMDIAAMTTAIDAAPAYFAGHPTSCGQVTPLLDSQAGQTMAGNFSDSAGNCYVWLNLRYADQLTGSEICKLALHEMGHLHGLMHSQDPSDVMYSPFVPDPIPAPCESQAPAPKTASPAAPSAPKAKARGKAKAASVCPPGTTNPDYCAAGSKPKRHRHAVTWISVRVRATSRRSND